jgi:hypothetical protein
MKLYLEAYRNGERLENGPGDNLYPLDGLTVLTVNSLKIFLQTCCCTSNNKKKKKKGGCCSYCSKGYDMWNNLPTGFEFLNGDNNKWWYEKGRSNREYASVYVDGGKKEHKKQANEEFLLQEGSSLFFRPPIEHRGEEWMVNMEFRVVAVAEVAAVAAVAAASKIIAVRSNHFISSPAVSLLSSDFKTPTTKAKAKAKSGSGTSPLSVYSCTPDGGYPIVKGVVIDNPYSGVTADHLRQAFGLTDEEKKVALAQEVEEGKKALAVELVGMGFSPDLKRKREEDDGDDDGDLMQFP